MIKRKLKSIVLMLLAGIMMFPSVGEASANTKDKTMLYKYGEYLYTYFVLTNLNEDMYFSFLDVSGDGQKEMIVSKALECGVYDYDTKESKVYRVDLGNEYSSNLYYYEEKKRYFFIESMGPFLSYYTIKVKNHVATRTNELRSTIIDDYNDEYTFKGKVITPKKYNEYYDKYYGGILNSYVQDHKLTAANIKKYCGYVDGENSALGKVNSMAIEAEYVADTYSYTETFVWDAVEDADGYELYRKQLDIRLDPISNYFPAWNSVDWILQADTDTPWYRMTNYRPGDKLDWYVARAYKIVKGKKVYGPYGIIFSRDQQDAGRA